MSNPGTESSSNEKLFAPPTGQTQMVAPQKKGQKLYKVFCLREFNVGKPEFKEGQVVADTTRRIKPGEIVEVTKAQARDLCKPIKGSFSFSGERYLADGGNHRHDLSRARLAVPSDFVDKKPLTPLDDDDILGD